jgi:acetylornithine deacetylase/succinyl-diaminopimelate desuccinylase-like protein
MYLSKRFAALPPRQKLLARIALYGGLTMILALAAWTISYFARPMRHDRGDIVDLDKLKADPAVKILQDYIRIDTSTTTGSELAGAEFLARHLEAAGLEPQIERFPGGKANLWAILEGKRPEAIVLHNHIDVYQVPDPNAWQFPPFEGVIDRAWIYGRGAFDMKSVAVAQLQAMTEMARNAEQPEKTLVFLASGSEESGSDLGSKWILANHPDLLERLEVVLTEGGVVEAVTHDEIKFWGIEFAQKWFGDGSACSDNRERLEQLRADLTEISETNLDLRLTPEVEAFLRTYAKSRTSTQTQRILQDMRSLLDHPDQFTNLPPYLKSLFRDEVAAFEVEPDPEGGYRMRIILHLLPGSDFAAASRRLLPDWATTGVSLTMEPPEGASHGSPPDNRTMTALIEAVRQDFPGATVGPYFLAWSATDARFFRQAGIPSYGFSPFLIFATDTFRRDTLNERIDIQGFVQGVDLYERVVRKLAG